VRRFPSVLAGLVTRRPIPILALLLLVTVGLGAAIPQLRADPSPRSLVAALEGHEEIEERFAERFGEVGRVVFLMVSSPSLLDEEPLGYVHQVSRALPAAVGSDVVARVEGPTITTVARREGAANGGDQGLTLDGGDGDGELTLDDLDGGDDDGGLTLDDLDSDSGDGDGALTLDDLDAGDGESRDEVPGGIDDLDDATLDALGGIVRAEPERFPMGLSSLSNLTAEIETGPLVPGDEVDAAAAARVRDALAGPTLLDRRLVSPDRTVAGVALFLADEVDDHRSERRAVDAIRGWLDDHPPPSGVTVRLAGLPYLHVSIVEKMVTDQVRLIPLTVLICLVVLFVSFRWAPAVVLSLSAVLATTVCVLGGMAVAGEKITLLNNILPALLIIIGISYAIHLLGRYREQLRLGQPRDLAIRTTVEAMTVGIFLTAATTAVGLGSLVVARSAMIRHLGVTAGLGVMAAFVISVLLVPSALRFFRARRWERPAASDDAATPEMADPGAPRKAAAGHGDPAEAGRDDGGFLEAVAVRLFRLGIRYRTVVIGLGAVLFVGSAAAASQLPVDSAVLDQFDPGDPAYEATKLQEEKLAGVRPLEVVLSLRGDADGGDDAPTFVDAERLAALDRVAAWADGRPEVIDTTSVSDFLHHAWLLLTGDRAVLDRPFVDDEQVAGFAHLLSQREDGPLDRYLADDGRTARLEVRLRDVGARASLRFFDALRERIDTELVTPANAQGVQVDVEMTGEAYVGSLVVSTVVGDMLASLTTAVFIIFGFIILLLRSPRLGLLSVPPNILPLTLAMAWMIIRDVPLNAATAITFSVSLGMAVDGSIHLLARFREERRRGQGVEDALVRSARGTGRAIVVSNLTLMAGFAVLVWSGFVPIRRFGELIAVTIAATTFTTLVLLPALLRAGGAPRAPTAPGSGRGPASYRDTEIVTV